MSILEKLRDLTESWLGAIVLVVAFLGSLWVVIGYPKYQYNTCLYDKNIINKELCKEFLK